MLTVILFVVLVLVAVVLVQAIVLLARLLYRSPSGHESLAAVNRKVGMDPVGSVVDAVLAARPATDRLHQRARLRRRRR